MKLQNTLADGSGTSCAGGDSISVTSNIVLYAQWTTTPATHTLSFIPCRPFGAGAITNMPSPNPMTVYQGSTFNLLTNVPTMSGYTFLGWNTALNGSGATYQPGASYTMTADTYLYAQWSSGSLRDGTPDTSPRSGNSICAIETVKYEYGNSAWQDQLTQIKTYSVSAAGVQTLINTQTMAYDTMGNPTTYLGKTLSWEGKQLTGVSATGQSVSYAYDENGLRTQKTVDGTTTDYYYNGSVLIGMVTGSGSSAIVQRFSYDSSGNVVSVDYSADNGSTFTTYYYLRNGQGDVVKLIDGSGNTVVQYSYDTWGEQIACTGALATTLGQNQPFRYRGYVYDSETGWYYLQSRYYDPVTCRFISADVLLSTGQGVLGHNSYAYCLNNPINMSDSSGCASNSDKDENSNGILDYLEERWKNMTIHGALQIASACGASFESIFILKRELQYLGTSYPPLNTETGQYDRQMGYLDCSQLAEIGFGDAFDSAEHQTARYQWKCIISPDSGWEYTMGNNLSSIKPGDAVFYSTDSKDRKTIFHVATYIGNGLMIDSTKTTFIDGVSIRSIDSQLTYGTQNGVIYGYASAPSS